MNPRAPSAEVASLIGSHGAASWPSALERSPRRSRACAAASSHSPASPTCRGWNQVLWMHRHPWRQVHRNRLDSAGRTGTWRSGADRRPGWRVFEALLRQRSRASSPA